MLSYRHAFHAGNHADILKHSMLTLILQSMQKKEKPYTLLDTHAGAGIYIIDDERAIKTGETQSGIVHLIEDVSVENTLNFLKDNIPDDFLPYLKLCKAYIQQNKYPGSPEIMRNFLRENDKLILMELHNTEIDVLRVNMKKMVHDGRLGIHHRDAFAGVEALTPPIPRRGMLLMDPSYEVDSDYTNSADSISSCHKRWPVGVLCLWYPLLKHRESEINILKSQIREAAASTPSSCLTAELLVDSPDRETGLYGSGMIIINPPWHLDKQMENILPFLVEHLGEKDSKNNNKGSWDVSINEV